MVDENNMDIQKTSKAPSLLERYNTQKSIYKNAEVFEISHNPRDLVLRKEVESIFNTVLLFSQHRVIQNIFIHGTSGNGKSAYSKYLMEQVRELSEEKSLPLQAKYYNCRDFKDLWEIPADICQVDIDDLGKKEDILKECLEEDLILILDEVDFANEEQRDFFYKVSRFNEIQQENDRKIMLILISNKKEWDKILDNATRSSLALEKIEFREYSKKQIKEILKQRLDSGLINKGLVFEKTLDIIVENTYTQNSDLRIGLRALKTILKNIENKDNLVNMDSQNPNIIKQIYDNSIVEVQIERMNVLDDKIFLILYAILECESKRSRDIYDYYVNALRFLKIKSWQYARFNHHTNELKELCFIKIEKIKERNYLVNELSLNISEKAISNELENRRINIEKDDADLIDNI